jgi:hypothetical protein
MFPEMSTEELQALSADISKNGQLDPIWTHEGKIIDGRHRYRICMILGRTPIYREWAGECGSILRFVVSKNLHRRHLDAGQRAMIAAEIKPKIEAEIREELRKKQRDGGKKAGRGRPAAKDKVSGNNSQDLSPPARSARSEAADMLNVNPRYVSDAEHIREKSPELAAEVKAGNLSIPEAKRKLNGTAEPKARVLIPEPQSREERCWACHKKASTSFEVRISPCGTRGATSVSTGTWVVCAHCARSISVLLTTSDAHLRGSMFREMSRLRSKHNALRKRVVERQSPGSTERLLFKDPSVIDVEFTEVPS